MTSPGLRALISLAVIGVSVVATWVASGLLPPPPPPPSQVESVFELDAGAVVGIDVRSRDGELNAVSRGPDGAWTIRRLEIEEVPSNTPAARPDASRIDAEVRALVSTVVALPEVARFPREAPLADFGLDPPRAAIELTLRTGSLVTLEIGARTSSGAGLYARIVGTDEILQIGSLILNEIAGALFRLRGARTG